MNSDLLAPIVNFGVVAFVLIYFGRKPFVDLLASRSQTLATEIRGAEAEGNEALGQLAQWETKWKGGEAEAAQIQSDAEKRMRALRATILAAAEKQAVRVVEETRLVGQSEAGKGRETLQQQVALKSVAMAREFLSAHVADKDRHQLVAEYLELVKDGSAR